MKTVDTHCHLWKEDVTVQSMPVISGSVQVPEKPGLGVDLDRDKLERLKVDPAPERPYLVRLRYGDGLTVYVRRDPDVSGQQDSIRFLERLHGFAVPGPSPSYTNDVVTDFWQGDDDLQAFARLYETAATVMDRRGKQWTPVQEAMWDEIFRLTADVRIEAVKRGRRLLRGQHQ